VQAVLEERKNLHREHAHECNADALWARRAQHLQALQARPIHERNQGGVRYDILNFRYDDSTGGQALRQKVRAPLLSSSQSGLRRS
jgi:hypothetical protein